MQTEWIAPQPDVYHTNRVAVADAGMELDLSAIARLFCLNYDPANFPALNWRNFQNPQFSAQLFQSGKILIVGIKNDLEVAEAVCRLLVELHHVFNWPVRFCHYKVHNNVYVVDVGFSVQLPLLRKAFPLEVNDDLASYDAVVWNVERKLVHGNAVTVNVYKTGRCIVSGATMAQQLERTLIRLKALEQFREKDEFKSIMDRECTKYNKHRQNRLK
jgi:TATA-box binding protein (TBP) (component of TFIID and TFIIIB)